MPYVNVRITRQNYDGSPVTRADKTRIIAEITGTLSRVLGKKPEHTHVVIDLIDEEDWGYAGVPTSEYRKRPGEGRSDQSATPRAIRRRPKAVGKGKAKHGGKGGDRA